MECNKNFEVFHENLSLKQTREERIAGGVRTLRQFLRSDRSSDKDETGIADVLVDLFTQGSYAMGTAVRPLHESDEFDVDVVLVLNLTQEDGGLPDSTATLQWLARRLRGNGPYKGKVEIKNRCVRLNYAGEFHLDVVPTVPSEGQKLMLPDKAGYWVATDPRGYMTWFAQRDSGSGGHLMRIVKYLKWWRHVGKQKKVTSVVLTALLAEHMERGYSDAATLVETMESLNDWLDMHDAKPVVPHPTLGTDMAERWTEKEFSHFKSSLGEAAATGREAFDEDDQAKSVELWQEVFGDQFPKLDGGNGGTGGSSVGGDKGGYVRPKKSGEKSTRVFG